MMGWKCESCGQKLTGKENYCPNCATKAVFYCRLCGKELDNGKHKYCAMCNTKRAEERHNKITAGGAAVAGLAGAAGGIVLKVISKGKYGGKS